MNSLYRTGSLLAGNSKDYSGGQHVVGREKYSGLREGHSELWVLSNDQMRRTYVNHSNELERGKRPSY